MHSDPHSNLLQRSNAIPIPDEYYPVGPSLSSNVRSEAQVLLNQLNEKKFRGGVDGDKILFRTWMKTQNLKMIYPGESTEAKLPATSLTQNTTSTRNHRSKVLSRDQKVCDSLKPIPIPMKLRLAGPVSLEAIQNIRQNIQLLHGSLLEPTRNHKVETYHTIRKLPLESLSSALNCTESVIVSSDVIPLHMHSDISVAMESVDEDVIMSDEIVSEESLDERFVYSDEYGDINQNDDISDVTKRSEHIEKIDEKTTTTAISIQSPQQVTNSQPFSVQSMLIHKQTETPLATYPTQSTTTRATSKRPVTIEQQVDLSGLTFARLKQLTGHY